MTETVESPVTRLLNELNIAYLTIAIPLDPDQKPIRSLEQLLADQGGDPGQIIRSLLFRTGSGGFALLAAAGGGKADWSVLRKHLNERRLAMAEPGEVLAATGFPVGAVPPVALPNAVRVLVDEGVFHHDRVVIGSGVLVYALAAASADLKRAWTDAEFGSFIKP